MFRRARDVLEKILDVDVIHHILKTTSYVNKRKPNTVFPRQLRGNVSRKIKFKHSYMRTSTYAHKMDLSVTQSVSLCLLQQDNIEMASPDFV
jgi:hypothetical protein